MPASDQLSPNILLPLPIYKTVPIPRDSVHHSIPVLSRVKYKSLSTREQSESAHNATRKPNRLSQYLSRFLPRPLPPTNPFTSFTDPIASP